ncbi:MAG: peptidoglycan DD-metalloendopeptidase family protein [Tidjanibacter sp.]|nr:peptidoglycan DD-metalloendopeptidase family protein [Tidjanibacter sp.]
MSNGTFKYFMRNMAKRHRVAVDDPEGNEVWYAYTSVFRMIAVVLAAVAVVFVATLVLAAYTRVLNIVPGYDGIRNREMMIENIIRLDSLERQLASMSAYTDNVAQIMEGRAPVMRSLKPQDQDKIATEKSLVPPSSVDSLLRSQMESGGRYGLNTAAVADSKERLQQIQLLTPVKGVVVRSFSPSMGSYGTLVEPSDVQQVLAVQNGTVIVNSLDPDGYTIEVQHSGDIVSIYKGIGQSHKSVGDKVGAGEALGSSWSGNPADKERPEQVEIQLWYNGTPLDPEKYILF